MDQQIGLGIPRGAKRELLMCPVHGVARLESDNSPPAQLLETGPQFGRSVSQMLAVVVRGCVQALQPPAEVNRT